MTTKRKKNIAKDTLGAVGRAFYKLKLRAYYGSSYVPMADVRELAADPDLAVVGRVRRWLENPLKIYPVSCTGVVMNDSYYDLDEADWSHFETISGAREFVTRALKGNAGVAVHFHKLRAKGTKNGTGLEAQGTPNFMKVFSAINEEVRRGNGFKNGAVLLYTDFSDPELLEFIGQLPPTGEDKYTGIQPSDIPWAKRAVMVDESMWYPENADKLAGLIAALDAGTIFLSKIRYDKYGRRLYTQVCTEIEFYSRSTCTLLHVNLANIRTYSQLVSAFRKSMTCLVGIWQNIDHYDSPYLNQFEDKQVGLGVIGLANLLARFGVTYDEFTVALETAMDTIDSSGMEYYHSYIKLVYDRLEKPHKLVYYFVKAFLAAGSIGRDAGLERMFTIAPTSNSSTAYQDEGFGVAPEISPPVADPTTKTGERVSKGEEITIQYPSNIELAHYDVSFETYFRLAAAWQRLMDIEGYAHAISFNVWNPGAVVDTSFLREWWDSPLKSLYYRWNVEYSGNKTSIQMDVDKSWAANYDEIDGQGCELDFSKPQGVNPFNNPDVCIPCGGV